MVQNVIHVTYQYDERLRRCQNVPKLSYGRQMLTEDGAPNRFFLMYLFCNELMAIQYLKDIGLLRSKMQCNTCGRDMAWSADSSKVDGYRWRCRKRVAGVVCNQFVKAFLGQYNRGEDYEFHLAHYMFAARCKAKRIPPYLQFLHLVANIDWSQCSLPPH